MYYCGKEHSEQVRFTCALGQIRPYSPLTILLSGWASHQPSCHKTVKALLLSLFDDFPIAIDVNCRRAPSDSGAVVEIPDVDIHLEESKRQTGATSPLQWIRMNNTGGLSSTADPDYKLLLGDHCLKIAGHLDDVMANKCILHLSKGQSEYKCSSSIIILREKGVNGDGVYEDMELSDYTAVLQYFVS